MPTFIKKTSIALRLNFERLKKKKIGSIKNMFTDKLKGKIWKPNSYFHNKYQVDKMWLIAKVSIIMYLNV